MSTDLLTRLRRHVEQVDSLAPSLEEMLANFDAHGRVFGSMPHQRLHERRGPLAPDELDAGLSLAASVETAAKVDANKHLGDDLMVDYLQQRSDKGGASAERRGWSGVVVAVAATILVVVGVVVVADGNSGDVITDPASSPSVTVAPAVAEVDEDPRWCDVVPQAWVPVCDAATFDGSVMNAVTAGGPGLVAVGGECCVRGGVLDADAVVWTSPDGFTWSRVPNDNAVFGGDGNQQMFDVAVGGPGLVAVGRDGPAVDEEGHAAVWTSPDGLTWTRVPHDEAVFGGPGEQQMLSVTVGGPGLVAVGFDGRPGDQQVDAAVWTSVDGFTWSRVPHDETVFGRDSRQMMLSVTVGGPGLVAVGSDGHHDDEDDRIDESAADAAVWTSPDGLTWSRVPHDEAVFGGPGEQQMLSVTVGGPGLVAVGFVTEKFDHLYELSDAAVWTSPDGLTWSRVPDDKAIFSTSGASGDQNEAMTSVTAGGPGLVAVGFDSYEDCEFDSAVWTSPDGLTWSRVPDERGCDGALPPDGSYDYMVSVTVGPSGLVAVGYESGRLSFAAVWNG